MRNRTLMGTTVLFALLALPLAGCAETAAEPLVVTYYYLPG